MLKHNLIANYLGQGWVAVMNLAFIPVYIKYLGIEAYGLIGLFSLLQAWLSLLDMGMTPTISREMGRFSGGSQSAETIRDLLRSVEIISIVVACMLAFGVWSASDWLANNWLKFDQISAVTISQAFSIMGLVAASRFLEGIYRSSLIGLQRQVVFNLINSAMATLRGVGAVAVLIYFSATIEAFFIWQGATSVITLIALHGSTYNSLPRSSRRARFSLKVLKNIGRYAGGMLGITFLSLLLTQIDKILLSKLLSLSEYGYYVLATVSAGSLYMLLGPIVQAWFPRLSQLHAVNETRKFVEAYHEGAQLVAVVVGSAALVLITYSEMILHLWTQDAELARNSSNLVKWLALGNLLNGLMTMPYQAQLAYGWTGYAVRVNIISVILIVPAILWAVPRFGAVGAAIIWVCLNVGYILVGVHYMYSKILTEEKWRWYREDILFPMIGGSVMAGLTYLVIPITESQWGQAFEIILAAFLILISSILGAPKIMQYFRIGKFWIGETKHKRVK